MDPIATVKKSVSVSNVIMVLTVFMLIAVVAGALGVWNWVINPWGSAVTKWPSLAKFQVGSGQNQ